MFIGGRDAGDTYQSSPAHVFSPRCPSRGAPTDPPGTGSSGGFGASPYNSSGSAIPTACGHQTGDTWRNLRQELDRMHLGPPSPPPDVASPQRVRPNQRPEDHRRRARPARTTQIPRLHTRHQRRRPQLTGGSKGSVTAQSLIDSRDYSHDLSVMRFRWTRSATWSSPHCGRRCGARSSRSWRS